VVPAGSYDWVYDAVAEREVVDPNSYHPVEKNPTTIFALLMSVTLGMQNAAYVIFFLLIIGGMFAILDGTGAGGNGCISSSRAAHQTGGAVLLYRVGGRENSRLNLDNSISESCV
jgi:uncharacterized ion transporter superfamily protein YfcC